MDNLDFEINVITDASFETEQRQLGSFYKTIERIIYSGRFDLFNYAVLKCMNNIESQSVSGLILIASVAKKNKNNVPLYNFFIAAIKDELERKDYTQERINKIMKVFL